MCLLELTPSPSAQNLQDHGVCPVLLKLKEALPLIRKVQGIPGIAFFRSSVDITRSPEQELEPDIQLVQTSRMSQDGAPKQALQELERGWGAAAKTAAWLLPSYRAAIARGQVKNRSIAYKDLPQPRASELLK